MRAGLCCLFFVMLLSGCGIGFLSEPTPEHTVPWMHTADQYLGKHEHHDRQLLTEFITVDPVTTAWCAAFVNSVLAQHGIAGSDSVHPHPLLARSFLNWGEPRTGEPRIGDVVVFPRGSAGWQGHVGFYAGSFTNRDGQTLWIILGGNQQNSVSYDSYDPQTALAVRYHR